MKRILAVILGLGILFAPLLSFAAVGGSGSGLPTFNTELNGFDIFTPPPTDKSLNYLGQVFGTVDGVIHGTSGQILAHLFYVFNYAMVLVASMILIYSVILSVINTAHEGEFMGRNTKPAWVIFRAIAGIGILVPKASGYSIIQILVMWVAVQGVGLADKAWARVVDYMVNEGGVIHAISQDPIKIDNMKTTLVSVGKVFRSEVCMYKLQDLAQEDKQKAAAQLKNDPTNPVLKQKSGIVPNYRPVWDEAAKTVTFGIPNSDKPGAGSVCGSYTWKITGDEPQKYEDYKRVALEQVVNTLSPVAKNVSYAANKSITIAEQNQLKDRTVNALLGATADYENIMQPALRTAQTNADQKWRDNLVESKEKGWITAGSYYWDMAAISNKLGDSIKNYQPSGSAEVSDLKSYGIDENAVKSTLATAESQYANLSEISSMLELLNDRFGTSISFEQKAGLIQHALRLSDQEREGYKNTVGTTNEHGTKLSSAVRYDANDPVFPVNQITQQAGWMAGAVAGTVVAGMASPGIGAVLGVLSGGLIALNGLWLGAMNSPGDPLAMLQMLGRGMVGIAVSIWIIASVLLGLLTTLASIGTSATGLGYGIQNSLKLFLPGVVAFLGVLFVTGMVLSVYVPLIPFMIFTFAAIGWLISVLEAIVAAPLVAAAITHPEGHDLMGKAEQAIMLLMGIFLRPVVMVIGFVAAVVMARVTLRIVNAGFSHAATAADITLSGWNIFGFVGLMIIYTMIVVSLVNLVFNAGIVKLWETIWMWVGFHQPGSAVEGALQEIKGGVHSGAQAAGDLSGGMVRGGGDAVANQLVKNNDGKWGFDKGKGDGKQYEKNPSATITGK